MKNAIILHGTGGTPRSYWFPKIREFLESKGYDVWVPQLPDSDVSNLETQLAYVLEKGKFNDETILIGHSAGAPLILSILEKIKVKIAKAVLVSGFYEKLKKSNTKILQEKYDWGTIKSHVNEIFFINSDDDPWGCNYKQGFGMFEKLGGTLIVRHGEGHMGSDYFNQPYKEFPLLEKILD